MSTKFKNTVKTFAASALASCTIDATDGEINSTEEELKQSLFLEGKAYTGFCAIAAIEDAFEELAERDQSWEYLFELPTMEKNDSMYINYDKVNVKYDCYTYGDAKMLCNDEEYSQCTVIDEQGDTLARTWLYKDTEGVKCQAHPLYDNRGSYYIFSPTDPKCKKNVVMPEAQPGIEDENTM